MVYAEQDVELSFNKTHLSTINVPTGMYFVKVLTRDREIVSKVMLNE